MTHLRCLVSQDMKEEASHGEAEHRVGMVTAIRPVHEGRCVFGSKTYHTPSLLWQDAVPMLRYTVSSRQHDTSLFRCMTTCRRKVRRESR